MRGRSVRAVLAAAVLTVAATPASAAVPATSLTAADYLAFADRLQVAINPTWDERSGAYRSNGTLFVRVNAAMLYAHANAALAGHVGASRQDARARALVRSLTQAPAFRLRSSHGPGWTSRIDRANTPGHFSLDPKVAEALAAAYQARVQIGLSPRLQRRVRNRIALVARSPFYARRHLNQVNWNADLYLADAVVNGRSLAKTPYRGLLTGFLDHARRRYLGGTTNLNTGYGFHYRPDRAGAKENRNSTSEYASMVLGVVLPYDLARAQGMGSISARQGEVARRWQRRVLYGDWTHAGALNWDTGHGYARWQLRRYWALAANGLLAVASSRRLAFGSTARAEAKYLFDQSLRLYDRTAAGEGLLLDSTFFAIKNSASQPRLDPALTAARFESLATRAAVLGLGTLQAVAPPPAYGYDPDIRRLAVTTPTYSTAITQVSQVGNGGAELSRLIDVNGVPLSGTGGNGATSTSFGLRLVASGRTILETQPGFARFAPKLGRLSANVGRGGGAFSQIHSQTRAGSGRRQVTVAHDFTPTAIHVRRRIVRANGLVAQMRFPAYRTATYDLIRGSAVVANIRLGTGERSAAGATGLRVRLVDGRDYQVAFDTPLPAGAKIRVVRPQNARSAPTTDRTAIVSVPVRTNDTTLGYLLTP
jgi:hypothetical protein